MLKQRIITALVLIPLVLWLVLFASHSLFSQAMILVVSLAAYEWAMLCGLKKRGQIIFSLLMLVALYIVWRFMLHENLPLTIYAVITVLWFLMTFYLVAKRSAIKQSQKINYFQLLLGVILLAAAWVSVVNLHDIEKHGSMLVMFLLLLIWTADTAAYFSGHKFGKHKLSPYVSPGKTWEGVIGAFIAVAILGFFMAEYEFFSLLNPVLLSAVGVAVAAVSVGGDLFESKIKRERGVKDSGNLLPGHGGVYDRIDSLIAAAPVYLLGIMMISGGTL
jgi:phosphatidate cytidylyltransferase